MSAREEYGLPHQSADWFAMTRKYDTHSADSDATGSQHSCHSEEHRDEESVLPRRSRQGFPLGGKKSKIFDF